MDASRKGLDSCVVHAHARQGSPVSASARAGLRGFMGVDKRGQKNVSCRFVAVFTQEVAGTEEVGV